MTLEELVHRHGSWLEVGVSEGPVISSRIRLARNINDYHFPGWANDEQNHAVWKQASDLFSHLSQPFIQWDMSRISNVDREVLFERHLISQEMAERKHDCGVFVTEDESLSIMVNEEDHIRIQSLQAGLNLKRAWEVADRVDDELENRLTYAHSERLGYLTSCPSNVGTGLRASVMLHLPGLVLLEEMEKVVNGISKIGLAVRGMWGEGTEAIGNMFQISNQITLGRREDQIIEHLEQIVLELIEHETNARKRLMNERAAVVEDHVARSFGVLTYSRLMTSGEALNLLSSLRLGLDLGLASHFSRRDLDMLFISTQPAHLQTLEAKSLDPGERDFVRAGMLRKFMKQAKFGTG